MQPGESLSSIAVRYGVSVNALANYNRIRNINFLRVGQSLQIPGTTMSPAPAQPLYQPPARTLADSRVAQPNGAPGLQTTPTPYIVDPYYPTPTPTLVIPTRIPPVSTTRIHVVAAADTLTGIANLYGTSAWAIKSRNGLTSDRIYRGQRLIIP
ncbi:MAG: LysM peptidoglycan-binding domain-containing protein [Chloroflexi bacterium]|nr:LysM peptidoglycan-binding domain-containing protein [Chloroflexota bacterium]